MDRSVGYQKEAVNRKVNIDIQRKRREGNAELTSDGRWRQIGDAIKKRA